MMDAVLRRSSSARPSSAASRSCCGEPGVSCVARCGRLVMVVVAVAVMVVVVVVVVGWWWRWWVGGWWIYGAA